MKIIKVIFIAVIFFHLYEATFSKGKSYAYNYSKSDTIKSGSKIKRKLQPPPPLSSAEIAFSDCIFTSKYSLSQRLKRYPFSKAVKILAVSYPLQEMYEPIYDVAGKNIMPYIDTLKSGLHITDGILNPSSLVETIALNKLQISRLTNIIFNATYKCPGIDVTDFGAQCFNPRNALIFYDKNGKVFDYLVICFECLRAESPKGDITVGTLCNQKYDLLKKFFIDAGINYGTIKK